MKPKKFYRNILMKVSQKKVRLQKGTMELQVYKPTHKIKEEISNGPN